MEFSENEKSLINIAKGAGIIFSAEVIGVFLGIVNQFLLGRILGPENFGLFNLGITVIAFLLPFAALGLFSSIRQFVPHYLGINRNDKVKGGVYFVIYFSFLLGIFLSIFLYLVAGFIAIDIFHNADFEIVIKTLSIAFPFYVFYYACTNITQAFKISKYKLYLNTILQKITSIVTFILLVYFGYRLFGAVIAFITSIGLVSIVYGYTIFYKIIPTLESKLRDKHVRLELFSIGWPLFFAGFSYLFIQYTDKTLLGIFTNAINVGIYSASYSIASLALFIFISLSYIFLPTVSELYGKQNLDGIKQIFHSISKRRITNTIEPEI
jgi:O-antigen/teichoic acid export membrane protein